MLKSHKKVAIQPISGMNCMFFVTNGVMKRVYIVHRFEKRFKLSIVAQSFAYRHAIVWV